MIEFNPLAFADELEKLASSAERQGFFASLFSGMRRRGIDRRGENNYSREETQMYREDKARGYKGDFHDWVREVGDDTFHDVRDARSDRAINKRMRHLENEINPSFWSKHGPKVLGGAAIAAAGLYALNKMNPQPQQTIIEMAPPPPPEMSYIPEQPMPEPMPEMEQAPETSTKKKKKKKN